jgi:hypothetical protein
MLSPPTRTAAQGAVGGVSSRAAVASHSQAAAAREEIAWEAQPESWDGCTVDAAELAPSRGLIRVHPHENSASEDEELCATSEEFADVAFAREPARAALPLAARSFPQRALRDAPSGTRLDALLRELAADVRAGGAPELASARLATGLPALDRLLGGGFPRGRLVEIAGPLSAGRTSLALALLAEATRRGALVSVIDAADAFDPSSAHAAGVDLARVLWARPLAVAETLRCAEHVLTAGGFELVLVDLAFAAARERPRIPDAAWPRLRKHAASASAGLVLLTRDRLAGAAADLALELAASAHFAAQPVWLETLESHVQLVRNRAGPTNAARIRFAQIAAA